MPRASKKTLRAIKRLIANTICLNKVQEFECAYDTHGLFEDPPEHWSEVEKQICDYQARISNELNIGIGIIFDTEVNKNAAN
jgi:hypothetical protein